MLAMIAYSQASVFYLDAALALALLSFINTIAAVSYKRHGKFL
jgi:multisubunit Na+/H+ antiporter MnhF subunit